MRRLFLDLTWPMPWDLFLVQGKFGCDVGECWNAFVTLRFFATDI
jgi:hypothetical protein